MSNNPYGDSGPTPGSPQQNYGQQPYQGAPQQEHGNNGPQWLYKIAKAQRGVNIAVLAYFGFGFLTGIGQVMEAQANALYPIVVIGMVLLLLFILIFGSIMVFRLSSLLNGQVTAFFSTIAIIIPCIGLLVLAYISGEANKVLKSNGIAVGLMGADPNSIPGGKPKQ